MTRRQTIDVKLSDGATVTVGPIRWTAWKEIKTALTEAIAGPLAYQVGELLTGPIIEQVSRIWTAGENREWDHEATLALLPAAAEQLKTLVPDLVSEVMGFLDRMSPELATGCIDQSIDLDCISATDFVAIRDAAFKVNDIGALVESEKNFMAALVNRIAGMIGSSKTIDSRGGLDTSTPSPQATVGVGKKSGGRRRKKSSVTSS